MNIKSLVEKCNKMDVNFEQSYISKTASGIYTNGQDSIKLLKWMACFDRYSERFIYYDIMASVYQFLNEMSAW